MGGKRRVRAKNDLIRLAAERACSRFRSSDRDVFNSAWFSNEFCALAGVVGPIDGRVVRAMLVGRPDIEPLVGRSHFRLLDGEP